MVRLEVFSDKDDKSKAPFYKSSMFIIPRDVEDPTHCSQRVGPGVATVMVCTN